jgi:hypothetical protein
MENGVKHARGVMDGNLAVLNHASKQAEQHYLSAAASIWDFNAKLIDMTKTNLMACLQLAVELSRPHDPADVCAVWSTNVHSHFQRLSEQSQELAALAERIASSGTEPLMRGFDQAFKRAP